MKINWRIRACNPVWWAHVGAAIALPAIGYFGLTAQDLTSWSILMHTIAEAAQNPYVIGVTLVSVWNAIYDPTSKGLCDCDSVLKQTSPR